MRRYSWNDSSACNARTLTRGCTTSALKLEPWEPSAAARSPLASTSTPSTSLPRLAARRQSAAATVVLPVPPLPATTTMRRSRRPSSCPTAEGEALVLAGRAGRLENGGCVPAGLDGAPFALDVRVGSDQERAALDPLIRASVHGLLNPQSQRPDEHVVGVADQRDSQLALG